MTLMFYWKRKIWVQVIPWKPFGCIQWKETLLGKWSNHEEQSPAEPSPSIPAQPTNTIDHFFPSFSPESLQNEKHLRLSPCPSTMSVVWVERELKVSNATSYHPHTSFYLPCGFGSYTLRQRRIPLDPKYSLSALGGQSQVLLTPIPRFCIACSQVFKGICQPRAI